MRSVNLDDEIHCTPHPSPLPEGEGIVATFVKPAAIDFSSRYKLEISSRPAIAEHIERNLICMNAVGPFSLREKDRMRGV